MRALMELVEGDRHIVRTADLSKVAPEVLVAARRAGILRPEDPGFEDISATDLARVLRALYGLSGRRRPVPATFDASAAPLGWMGAEKNAREVLFCPRPLTGLAKALARRRSTLVLVPSARHLTPALRERHGPGSVVELEALEEAIGPLGGRLVRRAAIAPDAPGIPGIEVRTAQPAVRLLGIAKRWTDMRICLLDRTTVRIDVGGRRIRCTHVDLGMAHVRTRRPTLVWEVLEEICLLHALKANVQQLADLDPEQAEAIITSAGMGVAKTAARTKAPFAAKQGPVSGSVRLAAKAAAVRASYEWEWSGDGGKTWTTVLPTLQAKTQITGLPVSTVLQFRFRAVTKTGAGDWSEPTSLLVK